MTTYRDPFSNPPGRPIPPSGPTPGSDWDRHLKAVDDAAREVEPPAPHDDSDVWERRHEDRLRDVFGGAA